MRVEITRMFTSQRGFQVGDKGTLIEFLKEKDNISALILLDKGLFRLMDIRHIKFIGNLADINTA